MEKCLCEWLVLLCLSMLLIGAIGSSVVAQNSQPVRAEQICASPTFDSTGAAHVQCRIVVHAPIIGANEKLSLQYHLRPGYDVSLPATIPNAPKSGVTFSSDQPWACVSQGAPQPPAHGCFLMGSDMLAAGGTAIFTSNIHVQNPSDTRDIQSCFRVVGAGADRSQVCMLVDMGLPDAELKLSQMCETAWTDGSFINLDCSIIVKGKNTLPRTYIRVLNSVLVGEILLDAKVLKTNSSNGWICKGASCVLDSDEFIATGQVAALRIQSRTHVPHIDDNLFSCTQVTTRTPKLAADRICVALGGAELTD